MKEKTVNLNSNFADKEIAKKPHLIHEVRAIDNANGAMALYYVYVDPTQSGAFIDALAKGSDMNLEDYGRVLTACYGEQPTPEVRKFLHETYGVSV